MHGLHVFTCVSDPGQEPVGAPQTAQTLQPRDLCLNSVRLLRVTDQKIAFRPESLLQGLPPQPDKH